MIRQMRKVRRVLNLPKTTKKMITITHWCLAVTSLVLGLF